MSSSNLHILFAMNDNCTVNLDYIRSLWANISSEGGAYESHNHKIYLELEFYLVATASNMLTCIDTILREIHGQTDGRLISDEQIKRIAGMRKQIELCSDIALFSIRHRSI